LVRRVPNGNAFRVAIGPGEPPSQAVVDLARLAGNDASVRMLAAEVDASEVGPEPVRRLADEVRDAPRTSDGRLLLKGVGSRDAADFVREPLARARRVVSMMG
jgi:hypothetical protein